MSHNPNRPGPLLSAESLRSSNSKWNICRWILVAKSEKQIMKAFCHGAFMCFYELYEFSCFTALCIKVVAFMITSGVHEVCGRCSKASWPCESPAKQYILCHWSDTGQLWGAVLSRNCESLTFLTVSQESYFSWCQADYYEGWGLHGRFILVESAVMDCLSEDKGLVAVREGYDRYRGDSQLQSWEKICERCWNQSLGDGIHAYLRFTIFAVWPSRGRIHQTVKLQWMVRLWPGSYVKFSQVWIWMLFFFLNKNWETFGLAIHKCHFLRETRDGGGSVEAHILFCLGQGKPAVSDLTDLTPWHPSLRSVGVRVISLRYCFDGVDGGFCKSPDESSSCLTVVNFIGIVKVPDWGDFCFFFIPR